MASTWPLPICFDENDQVGILSMEQKFRDEGHEPIRQRKWIASKLCITAVWTPRTFWPSGRAHNSRQDQDNPPMIAISGVFGVFSQSDEEACTNAEAEAVNGGHTPLPVNVWLVSDLGEITAKEVNGPECWAYCPRCASQRMVIEEEYDADFTIGSLTDVGTSVDNLRREVAHLHKTLKMLRAVP